MEIHVCVAWRKSGRKVLLLTRSSHSHSNGNIISRWAAVHKRVSFVVVVIVAMVEGVMSWNVCTAHHGPHNPRLCLITQAKNARFSHRLRSVILVVHPRLMFIIASGPAQCTTNQHIYRATEFIMCVVSHPPTHVHLARRRSLTPPVKCPQHSVSCTHVSSFHTNKSWGTGKAPHFVVAAKDEAH